jgi:anthranilate/para-aminobenzoate synthase component II
MSISTFCSCAALAFEFAGRPEDSGISLEIIQKLGPAGFPMFGVCMGHQCIGQVFGGKVVRAPTGVMHGKTSLVWHNGEGLLEVGTKGAGMRACMLFPLPCPGEIHSVCASAHSVRTACAKREQYCEIQEISSPYCAE